MVDLRTGEHYARKIVTYKPLPQWHITTKNDFKRRVMDKLAHVDTVAHVRALVPHISVKTIKLIVI